MRIVTEAVAQVLPNHHVLLENLLQLMFQLFQKENFGLTIKQFRKFESKFQGTYLLDFLARKIEIELASLEKENILGNKLDTLVKLLEFVRGREIFLRVNFAKLLNVQLASW